MSSRTLAGICFVLIISSGPAKAQPHEPDLPTPGLRNLGHGVWSITAEKWLPNGQYALTENPPCNSAANDDVNKILRTVLASAAKAHPILSLAAPLVDTVSAAVDRELRQQPGFIAGILSPNRSAACAIVGVIIPKYSTIRRIEYRMGDGDRG